jgi:hypothetical protein
MVPDFERSKMVGAFDRAMTVTSTKRREEKRREEKRRESNLT